MVGAGASGHVDKRVKATTEILLWTHRDGWEDVNEVIMDSLKRRLRDYMKVWGIAFPTAISFDHGLLPGLPLCFEIAQQENAGCGVTDVRQSISREAIMFQIPQGKPLMIISFLLGLAFLAAGGMKFTSPQEMLTNFANWGYPNGFHFVVGAAEVAGAIGLFLRPVAKYAALLLGVVMLGAFGTHVLNPPLAAGVPSVVLCALAFAAFYLHQKSAAAQVQNR